MEKSKNKMFSVLLNDEWKMLKKNIFSVIRQISETILQKFTFNLFIDCYHLIRYRHTGGATRMNCIVRPP